ncbi:VWA domain-containing protein [Symbiobacterium terraclitae]|uniref:VWA domain-containing protein n=1 Tax=Symbiobacterium terraclitae TaxID=557451 RepID=UPI0035B53F04
MVRRLWTNRLTRAVARWLRLFLRWLLVWAGHLLGRGGRALRTAAHVARLLLFSRDPNNLYVVPTEGAHHREEAAAALEEVAVGERSTSLLWAGAAPRDLSDAGTSRLTLWRGLTPSSAADSALGADAANRRYAYVDLLASPIRKLSPRDIQLLEELLERLARKWLDIDETFRPWPRRNRLDVGRTLRYNIPRYAGAVLQFRWPVKVIPEPQPARPARILVIGDVSHSMVHYVSILLFFFHNLNFRFVVESYVFSEKATYATPYLNGLGSFESKVQRLMQGARSWNAGTRFGSALAEIAGHAYVDDQTYVLIATDGKVSLKEDEKEKIALYMGELRRRARQVIFITPSAEFSGAASGEGRQKQRRLGTFHYGYHQVPVWHMGSPLWYGTLSRYADRLYLVRTVQDLIDMVENLLINSAADEVTAGRPRRSG